MRPPARELTVAMMLMATISCGYGDWPSRYDDFFKLPVSDRRTAILRYAPPDQLELHVHAMCDLHPAYEHLAEAIVVQRGAGIVDSLQHAAGEATDGRDAACRANALTLIVQELDRRGVAVDAATGARAHQGAVGFRERKED